MGRVREKISVKIKAQAKKTLTAMRPSLILVHSVGETATNCSPTKEGDNGKETEGEEGHQAEEGSEEEKEDLQEEVARALLCAWEKALALNQGLFLLSESALLC